MHAPAASPKWPQIHVAPHWRTWETECERGGGTGGVDKGYERGVCERCGEDRVCDTWSVDKVWYWEPLPSTRRTTTEGNLFVLCLLTVNKLWDEIPPIPALADTTPS